LTLQARPAKDQPQKAGKIEPDLFITNHPNRMIKTVGEADNKISHEKTGTAFMWRRRYAE